MTLLRHLSLLALLMAGLALAQPGKLTRLATGLENPRGVAVLPDGSLLVLEAGSGSDTAEEQMRSGKISVLHDRNGDGDFDDALERRVLLDGFISYNGLRVFGTHRDEVGGLGDVALLPDGRFFFTKDDPFPGYAADGSFQDLGVAYASLNEPTARTLATRFVTVNALAYDAAREVFYLAESGMNRLSAVTLEGEVRAVAQFGLLAHGQQAVPAGLALEPGSGEVLVTLFSGSLPGYGEPPLAYLPGDAKLVRVDPDTGAVTEVLSGLSTAVDVAVDELGNVFVLELATLWPAAPMPESFDLYAPDAPPDPGGYPRFSGRLSLLTPEGERVTLLTGLDAPTNLSYHRGALYISTGQGTPGRVILGPAGKTRIGGELWRLEWP